MTLEEKASQMMHHAPAIERLDVPAYDWWNEGLHGVAWRLEVRPGDAERIRLRKSAWTITIFAF